MGVGDEEYDIEAKTSFSSEVKRRANDVIADPLGEIKRIMEERKEAERTHTYSYYADPELAFSEKLNRDVTTLLRLRQVQKLVLPSTGNILRVKFEKPILPVGEMEEEDPQTYVLEFVPDVSGTVKILVGRRYENQRPVVGVGALIAGTEDWFGRREVTVVEGELQNIDNGEPFSRLIDMAVNRQEISLTNSILSNKKGELLVQ